MGERESERSTSYRGHFPASWKLEWLEKRGDRGLPFLQGIMPTHIRLERANPATPAPISNADDRGNHRGTTIADNRPSSLLLGNRRHVNVTVRTCSSHDAGNVEIRLNLFVGRLRVISPTVLSFPFFPFFPFCHDEVEARRQNLEFKPRD